MADTNPKRGSPDENRNVALIQVSPRLVLLRRGLILEYVSLVWMTLESVISIISGFIAGSLALLAFGADSLIEFFSAFVVAIHVKRLVKGADEPHGFETRRVESLTTLLLVGLIPVIVLDGLYSYMTGVRPESSVIGIAVALGAAVIMPILWVEKRRIGKQTNCLPLVIDAAESATCFFMSVTLLAGLLLNYFWRVEWVDYVAAGIILAFVAREALESIRQANGRYAARLSQPDEILQSDESDEDLTEPRLNRVYMNRVCPNLNSSGSQRIIGVTRFAHSIRRAS